MVVVLQPKYICSRN